MAPPTEGARVRTIAAAAHPLVLAAGAIVVLNDYVLREVWPGWLTGKLSDVGWLVVAPVLAAALLALAGVPARRARAAGLVGVGGFYGVLQLWPPLGAAINAGHVADAEDLLVLPALLGAVWAWRTARPRAPRAELALPLLAGVLVADDSALTFDLPPTSWPCGDRMEWDTDEPLLLRVSGGRIPADTDAFLRGLRLVDGDGVEVPLVAAYPVSGGLQVCAREGLRGDTDYTWRIGPWDERSGHEVPFIHEALPTVRFRTLPGDGAAAPDGAACGARIADRAAFEQSACNLAAGEQAPTDTGDTGDTASAP